MKVVTVAFVASVLALSASAHAQAIPSAAPAREGRVTIASGIRDGAVHSSAGAIFARGELDGPVLRRDGSCTLRNAPAVDEVSAGVVRLDGAPVPIELRPVPGRQGPLYKASADVPNPPFAAGAPLTAESSGGPDFPAFHMSVTAPASITDVSIPQTVARSGYTIRWNAIPGTAIVINIVALRLDTPGGVRITCRIPDDGVFTVPASTFASVPSKFDHAAVMIARVADGGQSVEDARVTFEAAAFVGAGPFPLVADKPVCRSCSLYPRSLISLAFGLGGTSRIGQAPPTSGDVSALELGRRVADGLHVVYRMTSLNTTAQSASVVEQHTALGFGVRWTPLRPRPQRSRSAYWTLGTFFDLRALYLTAIAGADWRSRVTWTSPTMSTAASGWSPMGSLALAWAPLQGRDWSLGEEFREDISYVDEHVQRTWMLLAVANLNIW